MGGLGSLLSMFGVCEDLKSAGTSYKVDKARLELCQDLEETQIFTYKPLPVLFRNKPIENRNNRIENIEMAQWLKTKPNNMSFISRIHMMEEENPTPSSCPRLTSTQMLQYK